MKFGDDALTPRVEEDYVRIAGSRDKFKLLDEQTCDCPSGDPQSEPVGQPTTIWDRLRDFDRELGKHVPEPPGGRPFPLPGRRFPIR